MQSPELLAKYESSLRSRRHEHFVRLIRFFGKNPTILDVGGTASYWQTFVFPNEIAPRIVLLNTFPQSIDKFISIVGDARDLSQFHDQEFDIVFSNSVIGHVGKFSDQMSMANEVRRVGTNFFVQTPNHTFPLDWRTLVPFFHFLPASGQAWCFSHLGVGTYKRAANSAEAWEWATRIRNLRRRDVDQLFPGASVLEERMFGLIKSFMIHNFSIREKSRGLER